MRSETPSLFPDPEPLIARDEMNFCEFPLAVLSERSPKDCTELEFTDTIIHRGEAVKRRVLVTSSPRYGLPTTKDEEVLIGLLAATKQQNNFTSPLVEVTRYELVQILGWGMEGASYKRLMNSLDVWMNVTVKYENAWWDNEAKSYCDVAFHVLDRVTLTKSGPDGPAKVIRVEWSDTVFKSFQASYVKQLNLTLYQSLNSSVAKRLFRFLDKHLYHHPHRREFDLTDLAFEHVGLSRNYEPWKVKQKLEPAIRELEEHGYLVAMSDKERYLPAGRGKYRIVFEKRVEGSQTRRAIVSAPVEENPLVAALIARGLHRDSAKKLVADHKAEVISERIEAFDWLLKTKDKPEKPSGYLFTSIEKEFPLPDGFLASRRAKATAEKKRSDAIEDTRKRREEAERLQAERRNEEARKDRVNQFLATLPTERREAFEAAALNDGPPDLVASYRKSLEGGFRVFMDNLRYQLLDHAIAQLPSVLPSVVSASA